MSNAQLERTAQPAPAPPRLWEAPIGFGLLAAGLGGAVAFGLIQALHPYFPFPELPELGAYPSAKLLAEYHAAEREFQSRNGAVSSAFLGAVMGLFIGLLTTQRRVAGGLVGTMVGGVAGAIAGYVVGLRVAEGLIWSKGQSLTECVLTHSIVFGAIAMLTLIALALLHNVKQVPVALIVGALAGGVASGAYNIGCSLAFPLSNPMLIPPKTPTEQAIWVFSFAIVLGVCVGFGFKPDKVKPEISSEV